jgi:hypothetical protein
MLVMESQMGAAAGPRTPAIVRGSGLLDRVDYRLIETPEEKGSLYLLRYRAYLHGGLILPSESQRLSDRYDDAPNAWTFGIYVDRELYSSIRLNLLTSEWRTSFSTELFGDVLHPRLDRGEVFIDAARFVADPEKAKRFPELPYVTLRLAYLACEYFSADTGLALVRPGHQAFYHRVFLHETIAEPRSFPNVLKKVALMASGFRTLREQVLTRFPIMRSTAAERRMLFERSDDRSPVIDLPEFPFERAPIAPHS